MRRWMPWWVLALVFVVLPIVEIYVLIQVGQVIGAGWTLLLLLARQPPRRWLVKHEGGAPGARCRRRCVRAGCRTASWPTAR